MIVEILFTVVFVVLLFFILLRILWMRSEKEEKYSALIPRKIWKIIITKNNDLPEVDKYTRDSIRSWPDLNPGYEFNILTDQDCQDILRTYFESRVLKAYLKLKPFAYKCDLARLCVLYVFGGVYTDFRLRLLVPLDEIIKPDITFMASDDLIGTKGTTPLLNGFIASIPEHPFLSRTILNIVDNVERNWYGDSFLHTTGPVELGKSVNEVINKNEIFIPGSYSWNGMRYEILKHPGEVILQNGKKIIVTKGGPTEFTKIVKSGNIYWQMWKDRDIFNL